MLDLSVTVKTARATAVLSIVADGRRHSVVKHTITCNNANIITVTSQRAVNEIYKTKTPRPSLIGSVPYNGASKYE